MVSSSVNDTCCDIIEVEKRSNRFNADYKQFLYGRFRRTRRECDGAWSYSKVGLYEHHISNRFNSHNLHHLCSYSEYRKVSSKVVIITVKSSSNAQTIFPSCHGQPYFRNPPGFPSDRCNIYVYPPNSTRQNHDWCLENEDIKWCNDSPINIGDCDLSDCYKEHVSCSQHETGVAWSYLF